MAKKTKILKWAAVSIIVLAIAGVSAFSWMVASALVTSPLSERPDFCAPPATYCAPDLAKSFSDDPIDVNLASWDGTALSGYYFPSANSAAVIVQHGYGGHRGSVMHIAKMLHDEGFGVLLMDLRAHGKSGGEQVSFGRDESQDMQFAFDFLARRADIDPNRIGLYGWSLGGATVLMHAAVNPAVKAVMADSPFDAINSSNVAEFVDYSWPFPQLIQRFMTMQLAIDFDESSALARIDDISPTPLYLLVAGSDSVLDGGSGLRLFERANEPKELWSEPTFDHVRFSYDARERFETELLRFFTAHLLGGTESGNPS